ncbi:MAG TPA: hypothetical protein VF505_04650 [Thermoanaerobaculia bacterium]
MQFDLVGHGYRDERVTGSELEPECVKPERPIFGSVALTRDLTDTPCVLRRMANPIVDLRRLYRVSLNVEEVENAIGDVELVDRIDDASARPRRFHLSDASGPHQLQCRALERVIELLRQLIADDCEQPRAEQEDDEPESRDVPDCEADPQACEALNPEPRRGRFNPQNDTRSRALSGST